MLFCIHCCCFTFCKLETPKRVLWQTVTVQMKCSILLQLSGSALCAEGQLPPRTEMHQNVIICDLLMYTMGSPKRIVSICKWNPSEYKGLTHFDNIRTCNICSVPRHTILIRLLLARTNTMNQISVVSRLLPLATGVWQELLDVFLPCCFVFSYNWIHWH